MFRERARTFENLSLALDLTCLGLAFGIAMLLRVFHDSLPLLSSIPSVPWESERVVPSDYAMLLAVSGGTWALALGRYGLRLPQAIPWSLKSLSMNLKALLVALLATGAVVFVLKMQAISRLFFAYFFMIGLGLVVGKQMIIHRLRRELRRSGVGVRHALVIGAGQPAAWFAGVLEEASEHGYELVGLLLTRNVVSAETFQAPLLGTVDDLDRVLIHHPVEEVFLVGGVEEMARLAPTAQDLIRRGRVVSLVTMVETGEDGIKGRITDFSGIPMLSFGPMPRDEIRTTLKRVVDIGASSLALICLLPLFVGVGILIKITDPGPVFFTQKRLGVGGRSFRLYKFRSMHVDAERILAANPDLHQRYVANGYKLPEDTDPRISKLGRMLRRSSIDELPQLWNVLRGEMSLVGPRPIVPDEIEKYQPYGDLFLAVRPGVTGKWQVSGRSNIPYPQRAFMDLDYATANSPVSDLEIILRTVTAVLRGRGAH